MTKTITKQELHEMCKRQPSEPVGEWVLRMNDTLRELRYEGVRVIIDKDGPDSLNELTKRTNG